MGRYKGILTFKGWRKTERPFLASTLTFLLAFAFHACDREQLKRKHKCKVESAQLSCWVTEWSSALLYLCACVCVGRGNLSASFLGVSSVFGKRNTRLQARVSRNEPWERLSLTQRALGRVNAFPMILWSSRSLIRQNAHLGTRQGTSASAGQTNIKCFQGSCRKCNFCPHHRIKKIFIIIIIIIYSFIWFDL